MSQLELVCLLPHSQFVLLLHGTARSITVASLKAQGPVNNLTHWLNTHASQGASLWHLLRLRVL